MFIKKCYLRLKVLLIGLVSAEARQGARNFGQTKAPETTWSGCFGIIFNSPNSVH